MLISKLFVYISCFAGCIYQVSHILPIYFSYSTVAELDITFPESIIPRALSYCIQYVDLFQFERYFKDKNISFDYDVNNSTDKRMKLSKIATVNDILKYTTDVEDLIVSCYIRKPNRYDGDSFERNECYEQLIINKFFLQEFVCYRIHLKKYENHNYLIRPLTKSLNHQNKLFYVNIFKSSDNVSNWLKIIPHDHRYFPGAPSGLFPGLKNQFSSKTQQYEFNNVMVQFTLLSTTRLPPPYHTMCGILQTLGYEFKETCISQCIINSTLKRYLKLPFSTILADGDLNYLTLNDIDMKNHSIELADIELECLAKCRSDDCVEVITIPQVTTRNTDDFLFRIEMHTPSQPFVRLTYSPKITFVELVIYILSTIGSWMGFSILSLTTSILEARHKQIMVPGEARNQIRSRQDSNRTNRELRARRLTNNNSVITQKRLYDLEQSFATAQQATDRRLASIGQQLTQLSTMLTRLTNNSVI